MRDQQATPGPLDDASPDSRRARLGWQCRRGMKELDLLLQPFFAREYAQLPDEQQRAFESLLEYPDTLLIEYLMGRMMPIDQGIADVVRRIRRAA